MMLLPRDSGPLAWLDPRDPSTAARENPCRAICRLEPYRRVQPELARRASTRRQIDRAIGRALVDDGFAARLLARPALAVDADVCGRPCAVTGVALRAEDLADFARQMIKRFWGPALGGQAGTCL